MFQSYALFPFLTVWDNVAFGLRHRSVGKAELSKRVMTRSSWCRWAALAKRRAGAVVRRPAAAGRASPARWCSTRRCSLLDEPLGALDAKACARSLKVELKALQERVGITFLYVTHDQEEALTMSDRLAVMNAGRIVQVGTPRSGYEEPADTYVADFLGAANLMEVSVTGAGQVRLADWTLTSSCCAAGLSGAAHAVIRPERVRIEEHGSAGDNRVPAMVERVVYLGAGSQVMLRLASGVQLQALIHDDSDVPSLVAGAPVHCYFPPDALRILADPGPRAKRTGVRGRVAGRDRWLGVRPGT